MLEVVGIRNCVPIPMQNSAHCHIQEKAMTGIQNWTTTNVSVNNSVTNTNSVKMHQCDILTAAGMGFGWVALLEIH